MNDISVLIKVAQVLELNIVDDNVIACIAAVSMYKKVADEELGDVLLSVYRSQSPVLLHAIMKTREFKEVEVVTKNKPRPAYRLM